MLIADHGAVVSRDTRLPHTADLRQIQPPRESGLITIGKVVAFDAPDNLVHNQSQVRRVPGLIECLGN